MLSTSRWFSCKRLFLDSSNSFTCHALLFHIHIRSLTNYVSSASTVERNTYFQSTEEQIWVSSKSDIKGIKQLTKQGIAQPSQCFGNEISLHSSRPFFLKAVLTWECPFLASFLQAVVSCSFEFDMLVLGEDFIFLSFLVSFFYEASLLLSPSLFFSIKSFTTWRENKWFWVQCCPLPTSFCFLCRQSVNNRMVNIIRSITGNVLKCLEWRCSMHS